MRSFNIVKAYAMFLVILLTNGTITIAQQSNNNAYVFNGVDSKVGITDAQATDPTAWQYFDNSSFTNDSISVEAWVYLIGESPGVKMPIVYRSFNDEYETFSLYIKNKTAYFSIGNGAGEVSTPPGIEIPAFRWIHLVGTYDGQDGKNLKLYYGGDMVDHQTNVTLGAGHASGSGGLYIGKSEDGAFSEGGAFRGLMDEVRIWRFALQDNHINNSGGNGNPSENFPQSIAEYLNGRWSFTDLNTNLAQDYSDFNNDLMVYYITETVNSKHLPFFVVQSIGDDGDVDWGDGKATSLNGEVTLRSAIEEANVLAGQQTIYFYIQETDPIIQPLSDFLPPITQPVILDGTSQSGYSDSHLVEINGAFGGLKVVAGGSTVKGLKINNSSNYGLTLSEAGGNTIEANQISGILISSSENNINDNIIANSTGDGISITAGAEDNQIGTSSSNKIFGNAGYGISIASSTGNQLTNNIVGTNNSGGTANTLGGIYISNSTGSVTGNTISGNNGFGISLNGINSIILTGNTVSGNLPDDVSGAPGIGIVLNTSNGNTLSGNEIFGNSGYGISIANSTGNQLTNNTVGTNEFGGTANTLGGISITNSTANLTGNKVNGNSVLVYL